MATVRSDQPKDGSRRRFVRQSALLALAPLVGSPANAGGDKIEQYRMPFGNGERDLVRYPQKRPLIRLTARPPQLETPFSVFGEGLITPNDAFFVRYHLSGIPTRIDPATYRLRIAGLVDRPTELSLDELKNLVPIREMVAVHQCSGNSRAFFQPRINGGQLGHGAMGNARWTGIALKTLMEKAGVRSGAVQVIFDGLDRPPMPATPDFVKALPIEHATNGEVMIAWAMNGEDLPMLNGYPLRLVVPGYYGTYWVKHLSEIRVVDREFDGFFMSTAYRVPDNECACAEPESTPGKMRPIGRFNVRSFITSLLDDARIRNGEHVTIRGIAFDGGHGIKHVDFSDDGGATWRTAELGLDFGQYAFREWSTSFQASRTGVHELKVRATNQFGETQPPKALWNPSGYGYNAIVSCRVVVV